MTAILVSGRVTIEPPPQKKNDAWRPLLSRSRFFSLSTSGEGVCSPQEQQQGQEQEKEQEQQQQQQEGIKNCTKPLELGYLLPLFHPEKKTQQVVLLKSWGGKEGNQQPPPSIFDVHLFIYLIWTKPPRSFMNHLEASWWILNVRSFSFPESLQTTCRGMPANFSPYQWCCFLVLGRREVSNDFYI